MQNILLMAESNDIMSILINEIDEITFQELGFYDESQRSHLKDEASKVQEFVLDETGHKILTPSSISRQAKFEVGSDLNYCQPRVEMIFDASHSVWIQLEKTYFQDNFSKYFINRRSCVKYSSFFKYKWILYKAGNFLYTLFVEQSISLFAITGIVCLLFLILF